MQQNNCTFFDKHSTPKCKIEKLDILVFSLRFWQFCKVFDCPNNLLYQKVILSEYMSRILKVEMPEITLYSVKFNFLKLVKTPYWVDKTSKIA